MSSEPASVQLEAVSSDIPTVNIPSDTLTAEDRIALAIKAIHASGKHASGAPLLSICQATKDFDQRKLSPAEEDVLVQWTKVMGRRAVPLTPELIHNYASDITGEPLGQHWTRRFLQRHRDIKIRKTSTLEACHAQALNATNVEGFYDIVDDVVTTYDIPPENTYNADEKGVLMGVGKPVLPLFD
ncbi:hypothetical protein BDW22DRAFT_1433204 [Trametopsis cervina]|nr:hypothetical protein BDW22DRAFT_1433204 [Trametopsis cervina]